MQQHRDRSQVSCLSVLSLCDRSGNMARPWARAGHNCWCVDLEHSDELKIDHFEGGGSIHYVKGNVLQYPTMRYDVVFAFPPCTDLAVSGARYFKSKGMKRLIAALTLVERCRELCEASGGRWMLENPVSTLSTYWRKPDFIFNPCDYGGYLTLPGDAYTKKTCLWTGGGFVMPPFLPVEPTEGSKMHRLPPSENRVELRSITPQGFANAVFNSNGTT